MIAYNNAVTTIRQLEYDRKREWETLHIVVCLMETVYTHVIHSIDTGEPCPTTTTHPNQTQTEINNCHVLPIDITANLTIVYPPVPPPPPCDSDPEHPCTAEYIWEEHGSFPLDLQVHHTN